MKVIIIDHARERMHERGATEDEVTAALSQGKPVEAPLGRKIKEMVFPFDAQWQGNSYEQKKVRVIYLEENDNLAMITVYAYFGKWEEK